MSTVWIGRVVLVIVALGSFVGACGGAGPVPEELESSLLTVEEIGGGFVEEHRGTMAFDVVGALCPTGREEAGDALAVLSSERTSAGASFLSPSRPQYTGDEPGDTSVRHFVLTADAEEIAVGMAALRSGFEKCYGTTWTVEGEELSVERLAVPHVGEDSFGVVRRHFADMPTAYVRAGEMFMILEVEEVPDPDDLRKITERGFELLVTAAADHLSG